MGQMCFSESDLVDAWGSSFVVDEFTGLCLWVVALAAELVAVEAMGVPLSALLLSYFSGAFLILLDLSEGAGATY